MNRPLILLIDDSEDVRAVIKLALERESYAVIEAGDGVQVAKLIKTIKPEAILLDLMLPDDNGLNMIAKIRKYTDAPIIVVSGKSSLIDKVIGFEAGADDYITKPFQMPELIARIKAHQRRFRRSINGRPEYLKNNKITKVKFGGWILDRSRIQVYSENGEPANLTTKEFKVLEVMVMSPNQVFSREQLLEASRGYGGNVTDRAIDTQIVRIRKKIDLKGTDQSLIQSVSGIGYMVTSSVETISE